ncbi:glycosyltransferase family 2 protein [Virgibacillus chiguensis]|uniref:Glycosyl transferase family 2 n=1 Tax=Virgibacillus chiguensis TaxID=411959 RepID=A0A1M5QKY7_9BACI|nr:glycosyltransferase family A protein [Virgibacillus chiguensis]SHH14430.1 Glycosyl transferase family 2 [Virgibacillus chiguensis]
MKVSVVIPTHNRANLLKNAVDSVIKQTYKNLEIIIVSDGSTDETEVLLSEYKRVDSRIKAIHYYPNKGGNYARNLGIKNSTGEYVAFLDDDDEWMEKKIELQIKQFTNNPKLGLIYSGTEITYTQYGISYESIPKKTGDLSKDILISNYIGTTSCVIVKKEILNLVGGFDTALKAKQDYDLWIRVCQHASVGAVKEALVKYKNSNTTNQISDDIHKYIKSMNYINNKYKYLYSKISDEILTKHKQSSYMFLVKTALRNNNKVIARKYSKKLLTKYPSLKTFSLHISTFFSYSFILKIRALKK